jgi:hypothetical protein
MEKNGKTLDEKIQKKVRSRLIDLALMGLLAESPAELPVEYRRKRRKRKSYHGKLRCNDCGFRIRGLNHAQGLHHLHGSNGHHTITRS